jgi:endonuclease YncB( thermonuclease family)
VGNRISTFLSTACLLVLATIVVAAEVPQHISGPARIIDGDGLKISSWEIRLFGIDAPEMRGGPEGRRARAALEDLIGDRSVDCEGLYFDRYGRVVAVCRVDGQDIGEEMLAIGEAVTYRRFLEGSSLEPAYLEAERHARDAKRGLWNE